MNLDPPDPAAAAGPSPQHAGDYHRGTLYKLATALRGFGWIANLPAADHAEREERHGTWTSPTGTARLTVREPVDEIPEILHLEVTGGLDNPRPWRLSGVWVPALVPALLAAAVQPPWPAPDPIAVLQGSWRREPEISWPPGQFYGDRWIQSDGGEQGVIDEIIWHISDDNGQDEERASGWHLYVAYGYALRANLATPRHVVSALVIALNSAERRYRWP